MARANRPALTGKQQISATTGMRLSMCSIRPAMLAYEWRELEMLCERLGEVRARLAVAEKTSNSGLIEGLNMEMDRVIRMRDQLVRHISTRIGSAAADPLRASVPPHAVHRAGPVTIPH